MNNETNISTLAVQNMQARTDKFVQATVEFTSNEAKQLMSKISCIDDLLIDKIASELDTGYVPYSILPDALDPTLGSVCASLQDISTEAILQAVDKHDLEQYVYGRLLRRYHIAISRKADVYKSFNEKLADIRTHFDIEYPALVAQRLAEALQLIYDQIGLAVSVEIHLLQQVLDRLRSPDATVAKLMAIDVGSDYGSSSALCNCRLLPMLNEPLYQPVYAQVQQACDLWAEVDNKATELNDNVASTTVVPEDAECHDLSNRLNQIVAYTGEFENALDSLLDEASGAAAAADAAAAEKASIEECQLAARAASDATFDAVAAAKSYIDGLYKICSTRIAKPVDEAV